MLTKRASAAPVRLEPSLFRATGPSIHSAPCFFGRSPCQPLCKMMKPRFIRNSSPDSPLTPYVPVEIRLPRLGTQYSNTPLPLEGLVGFCKVNVAVYSTIPRVL